MKHGCGSRIFVFKHCVFEIVEEQRGKFCLWREDKNMRCEWVSWPEGLEETDRVLVRTKSMLRNTVMQRKQTARVMVRVGRPFKVFQILFRGWVDLMW